MILREHGGIWITFARAGEVRVQCHRSHTTAGEPASKSRNMENSVRCFLKNMEKTYCRYESAGGKKKLPPLRISCAPFAINGIHRMQNVRISDEASVIRSNPPSSWQRPSTSGCSRDGSCFKFRLKCGFFQRGFWHPPWDCWRSAVRLEPWLNDRRPHRGCRCNRRGNVLPRFWSGGGDPYGNAPRISQGNKLHPPNGQAGLLGPEG